MQLFYIYPQFQIISSFCSIEYSTWKSLEEAGIEEARLARENGKIDREGIPLIAVIADDAWSKRFYCLNYNAPSGVVLALNLFILSQV